MSENTQNDIKEATLAYRKWLAAHSAALDPDMREHAHLLGHALWALCQPGAADVPAMRESAMHWARTLEARLSTFRTERPSH